MGKLVGSGVTGARVRELEGAGVGSSVGCRERGDSCFSLDEACNMISNGA